MNNTDKAGPPSKSERKRQMLALQALGETLTKLPLEILAKIPLEDDLKEAIIAARSMRSHEAIRRQLQYIGRLMRETDAAAITTALKAITLEHKKQIVRKK